MRYTLTYIQCIGLISNRCGSPTSSFLWVCHSDLAIGFVSSGLLILLYKEVSSLWVLRGETPGRFGTKELGTNEYREEQRTKIETQVQHVSVLQYNYFLPIFNTYYNTPPHAGAYKLFVPCLEQINSI